MAQTPSNAGPPSRTESGAQRRDGKLGHDQPADVVKQTPIRNDPRAREDTPSREDKAGSARRRDERDPVMPADDATLNTKI